jgi:hypothetical protein
MIQDTKTSAKGYDYAAKIGSLIAMAEDETLPEATRVAYRSKAEQLMREYRIAEEETIAADQFSILPRRFEVVLLEGDAFRSEFRGSYVEIFREIALHAGIRVRFEYRYFNRETEEPSRVVAVGYGYDGDIRLAEFLWTAAHLVFITRIDANVNPTLSDQLNCYYLRNSGMKRNDIASALWGSAYNDGHAHGRVQKLYLAECVARGEQPKVAGRGIQVSLYRKAYANAFEDEFGWRLRQARDAADSVGGALELPGRKERVNEAFYAEWPDERPMTKEERIAYRAEMDAVLAANPCGDCAKTKSATGKCKYHRPSQITQADRRRWAREGDSPEALAGKANGAAAARSVEVARTAGPRTQRAERSPERIALEG